MFFSSTVKIALIYTRRAFYVDVRVLLIAQRFLTGSQDHALSLL